VDMTGPPGVDWGARGSGVPLVLMVVAGGGGYREARINRLNSVNISGGALSSLASLSCLTSRAKTLSCELVK
jgi:hypothetical protein